MSRFVVFDVETPNRMNNRMSAIGITLVEDGVITEDFYSLVDPEQPFDYFNTQLTGISEESVWDAPNFAALWPRIAPLLESGLLVAHNASFDLGVLKRCLRAYELEWKPCTSYLCTVQMGRRLLPGISHRLNALCDHYGIALQHHHAASDSHACAELLLRYLASGAAPEDHIRSYSFRT